MSKKSDIRAGLSVVSTGNAREPAVKLRAAVLCGESTGNPMLDLSLVELQSYEDEPSYTALSERISQHCGELVLHVIWGQREVKDNLRAPAASDDDFEPDTVAEMRLGVISTVADAGLVLHAVRGSHGYACVSVKRYSRWQRCKQDYRRIAVDVVNGPMPPPAVFPKYFDDADEGSRHERVPFIRMTLCGERAPDMLQGHGVGEVDPSWSNELLVGNQEIEDWCTEGFRKGRLKSHKRINHYLLDAHYGLARALGIKPPMFKELTSRIDVRRTDVTESLIRAVGREEDRRKKAADDAACSARTIRSLLGDAQEVDLDASDLLKKARNLLDEDT